MEHSKAFTIVSWVLRATASLILLQTLYFKFTGAPESVYIFSTLGIEPWGRIGTGVMELVAAVLMLAPATVIYGAILTLGLMSGAILSHLTKLGVKLELVGDNGELFALAMLVLICAAGLAVMHRAELPVLNGLLMPKPRT